MLRLADNQGTIRGYFSHKELILFSNEGLVEKYAL